MKKITNIGNRAANTLKWHADEVGLSPVKRPSNTSSANPKSGKSFVEQPMPHSRSSSLRSAAYHSKTIEPTFTRPSSMKMTKAEHLPQNLEDMDEKGHKL